MNTAAEPLGRSPQPSYPQTVADWLVIAVVVALPWSTSASIALIILWLMALAATVPMGRFRQDLLSAAGGLPLLVWLIACIGMLWADVPWNERFAGLSGYHKLLAIPLLLTQFRLSERGTGVIYGFFGSCIALLIASAITSFPEFVVPNKDPGIPVRDYIARSTELAICGFACLAVAYHFMRTRKRNFAIVFGTLSIMLFWSIFQTAFARTVLVVIPVLACSFGFACGRWRGLLASLAIIAIAGAALWATSSPVRDRVTRSIEEITSYQAEKDIETSSGSRLAMWRASLSIVARAPALGHGTGSIRQEYRRAAQSDPSIPVVNNPHNEILVAAIQLGSIGVLSLLAMWCAHIALFAGSNLNVIAMIGLIVVVQNVTSSLFNSHLSDFFQGWLYVFGFGLLGGMRLRQRAAISAERRSLA